MVPIHVGRNHTVHQLRGYLSQKTPLVLQSEGIIAICLNTSRDRELTTAQSTLFHLCTALTGHSFSLFIPVSPTTIHTNQYVLRLSEGGG